MLRLLLLWAGAIAVLAAYCFLIDRVAAWLVRLNDARRRLEPYRARARAREGYRERPHPGLAWDPEVREYRTCHDFYRRLEESRRSTPPASPAEEPSQ